MGFASFMGHIGPLYGVSTLEKFDNLDDSRYDELLLSTVYVA
jgi:hypothetical protein